MHTFKITGKNAGQLISTGNPHVNGTIIEISSYRCQEKLNVGNIYPLDFTAIKETPQEGQYYNISGSWIVDTFHVTSINFIHPPLDGRN